MDKLSVVEIQMVGMQTVSIEQSETLIVDVIPQTVTPVVVGVTLPGPKGEPGVPAEVYFSEDDPDPDVGNEGAIWAKYVD